LSPNKELPHVLVLPEDRANRELATAFQLGLDHAHLRKIQILPEAAGWNQVLEEFENDHVAGMEQYKSRFMVLIIDFDNKADRLAMVKNRIPPQLLDRVFILGARGEAEDLKRALAANYEKIGSELANDCRAGATTTWSSNGLENNSGELQRLIASVRPILFG
jgi:hypothetical protein